MKVLVLGIDEFIGRRVAQALAACDWAQPMADVRPIKAGCINGVEALEFTFSDGASLAAALGRADAVVNCVGAGPMAISGTAHALFGAAARLETQPLIVHISSMSVYGSTSAQVTEEAPLSGELGPYARAKLEAEHVACDYARKVVFRPGCEYGPGADLWSARIAKWLVARRIGDMGIAGDGTCNLVHIDDLAAAVLLGLRTPGAVGKTFNLAVPNPPTWNEYLVKYARALRAVPIRRVSERSLRFESRILAAPLKAIELAANRLGLQAYIPPPITASFVNLARQTILLDCANARRVLNWTCVPVDIGIAETAAWFNQIRQPRARS